MLNFFTFLFSTAELGVLHVLVMFWVNWTYKNNKSWNFQVLKTSSFGIAASVDLCHKKDTG